MGESKGGICKRPWKLSQTLPPLLPSLHTTGVRRLQNTTESSKIGLFGVKFDGELAEFLWRSKGQGERLEKKWVTSGSFCVRHEFFKYNVFLLNYIIQ